MFLRFFFFFFKDCTIRTHTELCLSIWDVDSYSQACEKYRIQTIRLLLSEECASEKCADGTLAGFLPATVASVSTHYNLQWLRFCPRLSRCRGQHLKPVIPPSCKPENQKPTRESWRGSVRKKALSTAHYMQPFPFFFLHFLLVLFFLPRSFICFNYI